MDSDPKPTPGASEAMDTDGEQATVKAVPNVEAKSDNSVMASSSVIVPTILVSLHPLDIMNVSEHWTRIRAQKEPGSNITIIGAFIGKQKGRNIEIMNSFELKFDIIESKIVIDSDYYKAKEQQFKQVFPDLDFLGWYSNGDLPNEGDMNIHHQIIVQIHESPLFLKLNPMVSF